MTSTSKKIEFYEDMYKKGRIKKDGSAYIRLQKLRGTTEKDKIERLKKFLHKRQEDKKNGS
jgi:hypothetical protein